MSVPATVEPALSPAAPRIALLDVARGIAIVAMVIYHFTWDLRFYLLITLDVTAEPGWIAFQRAIVGSFVLLSGISLMLAHREAIRWRAYWRRFAMLAGAALLVSVGTLAFAAETFVFFGVLHALALFSLLGLAFLRLPVVVILAVAAVILALPLAIADPVFGSRWLGWIGLYDVPPLTEDLVPVSPWFGVFLIGMALARIGMARGWDHALAAVGPGRALGWLAKAGRWSLVIYLIHQPILLAALYPVAALTDPGPAFQAQNFTQSCQAECYASSGYVDYCTAYCSCALDRIQTEDLWALLEAETLSPQANDIIADMVQQCTAEAAQGQ
ncbi:heparan-alpha-glucosaminide N-acetyltransferase [Pelagibacterium lentulum]|uniref:Membrane protein n=1 Tax=Pelagibacterium lentulum TaxID=2029865 RepID=A0A916REU2_9HYPH|nr:heparan-alpha-glucosaminide N-acetyltransferase [Pelagibacterium lentulum]GGA50517.1 membrane protein [Pelagibacterium lentulum]